MFEYNKHVFDDTVNFVWTSFCKSNRICFETMTTHFISHLLVPKANQSKSVPKRVLKGLRPDNFLQWYNRFWPSTQFSKEN